MWRPLILFPLLAAVSGAVVAEQARPSKGTLVGAADGDSPTLGVATAPPVEKDVRRWGIDFALLNGSYPSTVRSIVRDWAFPPSLFWARDPQSLATVLSKLDGSALFESEKTGTGGFFVLTPAGELSASPPATDLPAQETTELRLKPVDLHNLSGQALRALLEREGQATPFRLETARTPLLDPSIAATCRFEASHLLQIGPASTQSGAFLILSKTCPNGYFGRYEGGVISIVLQAGSVADNVLAILGDAPK